GSCPWCLGRLVTRGIVFGSQSPQAVWTLGRLGSVANAGLSLNRPSPFRSRPVMILNGRPELTETKGENRIPSGAVKLPPMKTRTFVSKPARLYSFLRSYWLAGKDAALSVSLFALPSVKYPNRVTRRVNRALTLVIS